MEVYTGSGEINGAAADTSGFMDDPERHRRDTDMLSGCVTSAGYCTKPDKASAASVDGDENGDDKCGECDVDKKCGSGRPTGNGVWLESGADPEDSDKTVGPSDRDMGGGETCPTLGDGEGEAAEKDEGVNGVERCGVSNNSLGDGEPTPGTNPDWVRGNHSNGLGGEVGGRISPGCQRGESGLSVSGITPTFPRATGGVGKQGSREPPPSPPLGDLVNGSGKQCPSLTSACDGIGSKTKDNSVNYATRFAIDCTRNVPDSAAEDTKAGDFPNAQGICKNGVVVYADIHQTNLIEKESSSPPQDAGDMVAIVTNGNQMVRPTCPLCHHSNGSHCPTHGNSISKAISSTSSDATTEDALSFSDRHFSCSNPSSSFQSSLDQPYYSSSSYIDTDSMESNRYGSGSSGCATQGNHHSHLHNHSGSTNYSNVPTPSGKQGLSSNMKQYRDTANTSRPVVYRNECFSGVVLDPDADSSLGDPDEPTVAVRADVARVAHKALPFHSSGQPVYTKRSIFYDDISGEQSMYSQPESATLTALSTMDEQGDGSVDQAGREEGAIPYDELGEGRETGLNPGGGSVQLNVMSLSNNKKYMEESRRQSNLTRDPTIRERPIAKTANGGLVQKAVVGEEHMPRCRPMGCVATRILALADPDEQTVPDPTQQVFEALRKSLDLDKVEKRSTKMAAQQTGNGSGRGLTARGSAKCTGTQTDVHGKAVGGGGGGGGGGDDNTRSPDVKCLGTGQGFPFKLPSYLKRNDSAGASAGGGDVCKYSGGLTGQSARGDRGAPGAVGSGDVTPGNGAVVGVTAEGGDPTAAPAPTPAVPPATRTCEAGVQTSLSFVDTLKITGGEREGEGEGRETPRSPAEVSVKEEAGVDEQRRAAGGGRWRGRWTPGRPGMKPLAPPLNGHAQYHVFFLYHHNDRDWVLSVMERLEAPALGFLCCCHERDFDCRTSLIHSTHFGIKNSLKTVIVMSPDFVCDTWNHSDMQLLSEMDVVLVQKDLITVLLQDCDIPHLLSDLVCIDAASEDWWGHLLAQISSTDATPITDETGVSMSSSLVGLNPNLQSGHLLLSIKSRCRCCGREIVDAKEMPDDLIAHGIQIPLEEYQEALEHLMCDPKFRCHVWCYNAPAALVFFTLLLALCLAVIPLIEAHLIFHGQETGLEFVHAGIVWLCALTAYMVVIHISKRRMKESTYKRLTYVNTILIKYNLLAGVENLGLADCNKYYLHFFYFEMGPCLAYLQELMVSIEEYSTCFQNQTAESGDATIEMEVDDTMTATSDRSRVLDSTNITNATMQNQAEDLILENSGEYINQLITKKLERPRRIRHVRDAPCLCQYVEQRVYKMIV